MDSRNVDGFYDWHTRLPQGVRMQHRGDSKQDSGHNFLFPYAWHIPFSAVMQLLLHLPMQHLDNVRDESQAL